MQLVSWLKNIAFKNLLTILKNVLIFPYRCWKILSWSSTMISFTLIIFPVVCSKDSSWLRDSLVQWISKNPCLRIYQGNWRLISQQNLLGKFALLPLWPRVIRSFKIGKRWLWWKICQILSFSSHALFIGGSNVTFRV